MQERKPNKYIKRPFVIGTLFYIVGLIGGERHNQVVQFSFFFVLILLCTIAMYIYYKKSYIWIYMSITCVGMVSIVFHPTLRDEATFARQDGAYVCIQGEVVEYKQYPYGARYVIRPSSTNINDHMIKANSLVQVEAQKEFESIGKGDIIKAYGKIEALSFSRNPGGFDEQRYLLIRGICSKIQARTIILVKKSEKLLILSSIQDYYAQMFEKIMPWNEAQIMKAMLIGDKALLSNEIKQLYQEAGIAHILAISGLHISVVAGVLWWVCKKINLSRNIQIVVVLIILWIYAGVIGFGISITRAVVMASTISIGKLLDEQSDGITSLCFAAIVVLLIENLYLWDVGFQLSFGAVASLLLLTPLINKIYWIHSKIRRYISPVVAVTIGTTPILAYYYYTISPIGLILNLFLIPLATVVVIIGLIVMILYPLHIVVAQFIIGSAYYLLLMIEKICTIALKIPFATIIVGQPGLVDFVLYILFWVVIFTYLYCTLEQRQKSKKYIVAISMMTISIAWIKSICPKELAVTFLDVGQGDCIIITTPYRQTFLIDGGSFGSGKKIEQFLKFKGIRTIDGVVVSHAHSDHMEGIKELIGYYPISNIFVSGLPLQQQSFIELYQLIQEKGIMMYQIKQGDFAKYKDVMIQCVYPVSNQSGLQGNNASVVLVLTYGGVSYYFTGDIEMPYEQQLVEHAQRNQINILKVPHHGSGTSSGQALLDCIAPNVAIVSCAKNNVYGHPDATVIDRYNENNIPVIQTKDVGAIMMYSDGRKVSIETMKDKEKLWK